MTTLAYQLAQKAYGLMYCIQFVDLSGEVVVKSEKNTRQSNLAEQKCMNKQLPACPPEREEQKSSEKVSRSN